MSSTTNNHIGITLFDVKKVRYLSRIVLDYTQSCYTVSYIKQGNLVTISEGKEYAAQTGDVLIHRPNIPFSVISKEGGVHYLFNLDVKVQDEEDFFRVFPLHRVGTVRSPALYERKFDELWNIWLLETGDGRNVQSSFLALFLLYEIMESFKAGRKPSMKENYETDRFNQAVQYMEQKLEYNISELAGLYHMDPVYFSRAFKKEYGMTPTKMMYKLRLLRAKKLLENPEMTTEEIARQCGFYDASHFSRTFQKAFKLTPSHYRKSIKNTKTTIAPTWIREDV